MTQPRANKTALMLLLELEFGRSIESMLREGTVDQVARKLGRHKGVISRWRARLNVEAL